GLERIHPGLHRRTPARSPARGRAHVRDGGGDDLHDARPLRAARRQRVRGGRQSRDRHDVEGRRRDGDRRGQPGRADSPDLGCGGGGARHVDVVAGARRLPEPEVTMARETSMGSMSRRAFVRRAGVVTLALGGAWPGRAHAAGVSMRLGWLANAQYAGDFVALDKGWFKERGIELRIDPGGPSIDPISLTAGGSSTIGNVASIAAMFLARSNGLPVRAFATALQRHPFAFITLDKRINSPKDFVGKKIGIQATARPLINAVIAKYGLPRAQVHLPA